MNIHTNRHTNQQTHIKILVFLYSASTSSLENFRNCTEQITCLSILCKIIPNISNIKSHMLAGPWAIKHFCRFLTLKGIKIALLVQKLRPFLLNLCKDYFTLQHFRNCNLTSVSPKSSTRWPQTPGKGITMGRQGGVRKIPNFLSQSAQ